MLVIMAETHKMLVRIANIEDPDQTASSDLGLHCLSKTFLQATLEPLLLSCRQIINTENNIQNLC